MLDDFRVFNYVVGVMSKANQIANELIAQAKAIILLEQEIEQLEENISLLWTYVDISSDRPDLRCKVLDSMFPNGQDTFSLSAESAIECFESELKLKTERFNKLCEKYETGDNDGQ